MIEGEANTELAQSMQRFQLGRSLANDLAITDLEFDAARVECIVRYG